MVGGGLLHYLYFHITEKLPAGYKILISTTALSGTGTSIQLKMSFLMTGIYNIYTAELVIYSLDILVTVALEELPLRIHLHLVVCYQQIVVLNFHSMSCLLDVLFLLYSVVTLSMPTSVLASFSLTS